MRFDLIDLRLFCDVVDSGSITAGAERSALALAAAGEMTVDAALVTLDFKHFAALVREGDPRIEGA